MPHDNVEVIVNNNAMLSNKNNRTLTVQTATVSVSHVLGFQQWLLTIGGSHSILSTPLSFTFGPMSHFFGKLTVYSKKENLTPLSL